MRQAKATSLGAQAPGSSKNGDTSPGSKDPGRGHTSQEPYGPGGKNGITSPGSKDPGRDNGDDWDKPIVGETKGVLGPIAAQVLMQILYTAQYCRHDLLRATGRLATMIAKWNSECDRRLHRLVCYVNSCLLYTSPSPRD